MLLTVANVSFADESKEDADYASGKVRIVEIMSNDETGIAAYNKRNIQYAETKNVATDLDIPEIVDYFGCKTLMGKSYFEETLKLPISPEAKDTTLLRRQNVIKALVENPELKKEVDALLELAKQGEQKVTELLSDLFKGESCPELKQLEQIKEQSPFMYPLSSFLTKNTTGRFIKSGSNLLSVAATAFVVWRGEKLIRDFTERGMTSDQFEAVFGYSLGQFRGAMAFYGFLGAFSAYQEGSDYKHAFEKRKRIHGLNKLISIADRFEVLYSNYDITSQFKISDIESEKGAAIVDRVRSKRYKDEDCYLFSTPLVHSFLYELYEEERHLAEVFACVAEMDVYNAIATKIIDSEYKNNKICFVGFLDENESKINAKNFWNVIVPEDAAIANNLFESKHVILSGPNAGGKTTSIRSILQNILLGQTFGVAAAESFEFTMFDVVHSYIHISDDLIGGLSLFASEVKRAKEVQDKMLDLKPGAKFFFALDELFTGTAAEQGEVCAYKFVDKISKLPGAMFVYATHFDKLKDLGDSNDYCTNYKVDAPTRGVSGEFVYPFTLSQGASDVNIAIDIANNANLFD